jgi:hypothetical protein
MKRLLYPTATRIQLLIVLTIAKETLVEAAVVRFLFLFIE